MIAASRDFDLARHDRERFDASISVDEVSKHHPSTYEAVMHVCVAT